MSLFPVNTDPLDFFRPSLLLDQHFGLGLDDGDFLEPCCPRRQRRMLLSSPYSRNWRSLASRNDTGSKITHNKNNFQVRVDVQQFSPEEISVKASDNTITIEGKHEEKEDEHGFISRHFVRKYTLPKGHNVDLVESKLSSDGVLTITAPKTEDGITEREIPIALTGKPSATAIEEGKKKKKTTDKNKMETQ